MSSRATAEAAPEPLIQNVPAESSAAAPRQTRPQHIDDEATDIECDPRPFAPEPDDIFSTSDTRTRPTYRPGNQCFINASLTALFACDPVRRLLQHVHTTKSTAPPSARWRAYNKKFKLIARHPRTTPFRSGPGGHAGGRPGTDLPRGRQRGAVWTALRAVAAVATRLPRRSGGCA